MHATGTQGRSRAAVAFIGCLLAVLVAPATASAGRLDQQQATIQDMAAFRPAVAVGQTFIASTSGDLDRVDVALQRLADCGTPNTSIAVDILGVLGGRPTDAVLATQTVDWATLAVDPGFVSFDLDQPIEVTPGSRYAIAVSAVGGDFCTAAGRAAGDPYGPGDRFTRIASGPWELARNQDMAFKTYVAPASAMCAGRVATHVGTKGDDTIVGTSGHDVIAGLGGEDKIKGLAGDDRVCGGKGEDTIHGGTSEDRLKGHGSADLLTGAGGSDSCVGGPGGDRARSCEIERGV